MTKEEASNGLRGYALRSSGYHMWWFAFLVATPNAFDHLSVWYRFSSNCLLKKSVEKFAAGARGSSVEAEGELVKVVVKMLSADCALVRSQQPSLNQRCHAMDTRKEGMGIFAGTKMNPAVMNVANRRE